LSGRTADESPEPGAGAFCIKPGYAARDRPDYFLDVEPDATGRTHQPQVYPLAGYLAERFGCTHIIDLGCGQARKLARLHPRFEIIGVDRGANLEACRKHPFGTWVESDLGRPGPISVPEELLSRSVIVTADLIEHLVDPRPLLAHLRRWLEAAPVCLLSTPERDLARGPRDGGPPPNPAHVREWNLEELQAFLCSAGLNVAFMGLTCSNDRDLEKNTTLAVIERTDAPSYAALAARTPPGFRVTAILSAYNEADVIAPAIHHLVEQGIDVYLVDNWSTDGTLDRARGFLDRGLLGMERYPPDGPSPHFRWAGYLRRVEQLTRTLPGDWFIHHDADEVRRSPWLGVDLRRALYAVDRAGSNCVDHTVIEFPPVDDDFAAGADFEAHFTRFDFGRNPGHFVELKAWKRAGVPISLAETGGHEVRFPGRRTFPYKFLLKHYPIRSQAHGERKVFAERQVRNPPEERAIEWNVHYDHLRPGHRFLKEPAELIPYDEASFNRRFLVERLSGVGISRSR
jgi:SAM-dependent methyltransferase